MSSNGQIVFGADTRGGTRSSSSLNGTVHAGGDQGGGVHEDNWSSTTKQIDTSGAYGMKERLTE